LDIGDFNKMALMETLRKERKKAKAKKEADELFEEEKKLIEKSRKPRTIRKAPIDKLKSVRRASSPSQEALERSDIEMPSRRASSPSQEALERSEVKAPKKTREKFLGLFEIDEDQPDWLEEIMSVNKSGGHIKKYNMGGSVRGCGKAMRGYGRANYSKKNI
jgi:hypothetical protein